MVVVIKILMNSFTGSNHITTRHPELTSIYPMAHWLNHSCHPNIDWVSIKGQLRLVSVKPIKSGQELTISYCESWLSYQDRQGLLRERYLFGCECRLCSYEQESNVFCNLHKSLKKKINSCDTSGFREYFKKNYPLMTRLENDKKLNIRSLIERVFDISSTKGVERCSKQKLFLFNREFFAHNEPKLLKVAAELSADEEAFKDEAGLMLSLMKQRNKGKGAPQKTIMKQFVKELRRIFGLRNTKLLSTLVVLTNAFRAQKKPQSLLGAVTLHTKIMKQFYELSGLKNYRELGKCYNAMGMDSGTLWRFHDHLYFLRYSVQLLGRLLDEEGRAEFKTKIEYVEDLMDSRKLDSEEHFGEFRKEYMLK